MASFGQEIANHSSLSEENRKQIEQCVVTVKNDWERLDEKIEWRLSRFIELFFLVCVTRNIEMILRFKLIFCGDGGGGGFFLGGTYHR